MRNAVVAIVLATGAVWTPAAQQMGGGMSSARRPALEGEFQGTLTATRPRMAVESRVTKGAPYAAEAITEFVQVLADGNRIVQKHVTRTYRDSEGRTRREQTVISNGNEMISVSIVDPVAGTSIILDPETRTAHRSNVVLASPARVSPGSRGGGGAVVGGVGAAERRSVEAVARAGAAEAPAQYKVPQERTPAGDQKITTESLGQKTIEGILADGTRTTTVIPAGAIGNEQPITIVSEQWFSPELQVLVSTRHADPRGGETIYRLANIVRGEQDRSLFEVPPDYTVKEPVTRTPMMKFER